MRRRFDTIASIRRRSRSGAKKRGLEFKVSLAYLKDLYEGQAGRCALTGTKLILAATSKHHGRGRTTASIDRIDSAEGYVPGNVQWVHKTVNQMKWNLGQDLFIDFCRRVAKKFQGD
jgi:hypothetical protein